MLRNAALIGMLALAGCSPKADTFTLYRNSPIDHGLRVHWATFDAVESGRDYNRNNCEMAARLLNANVAASTKAAGQQLDTSVGFWCEAGGFKDAGENPSRFAAAFPTDTP